MAKILLIENCLGCPFYITENNVLRYGAMGEVAKCGLQNNKEIEFCDKMDVPQLYDKVHADCPLQNL